MTAAAESFRMLVLTLQGFAVNLSDACTAYAAFSEKLASVRGGMTPEQVSAWMESEAPREALEILSLTGNGLLLVAAVIVGAVLYLAFCRRSRGIPFLTAFLGYAALFCMMLSWISMRAPGWPVLVQGFTMMVYGFPVAAFAVALIRPPKERRLA